MFGVVRDPAGQVRVETGGGVSGVVAAGAGDNTPYNGSDINREDFEGGFFILSTRATLAANKTCITVGKLQHADDNGAGAPGAYADAPAGNQPGGAAGSTLQTITDSGAGGTQRVATKISIGDESKLKKWIRLVPTPDLNAGATDTAEQTIVHVGATIVNPENLI